MKIYPPDKSTQVTDRIARILESRIRERCGASVSTDLNVYLDIKPGIGSEGFRISDDPKGGIRIAGSDERGLLYGVGKFLHASDCSRGEFTPSTWRGMSVPEKPVRGIYFATHFYNYYHVAPIEQIERYVEDLALWGFNSFAVWFDMHHYNGIDDPGAQADLARLLAILKAASDLGLNVGTPLLANEGYANSPEELRADWQAHEWTEYLGPHYHVELCPNKPGAIELELKWLDEKFEAFGDVGINFIWLWPYDQGGCTCEKCRPWGANGFLRIAEPLAREYRRRFPKGNIVLSTWLFDNFGRGEWAGLAETFDRERPDWVDYIMADDQGSMPFPEYPLKHGSPGGIPMLNFPEISMHLNYPWGGYGANPYPRHLQLIWDSSKDKLSGGFPYSEGIYEDINKVIWSQFYWDSGKPAAETVKEYIAYNFSPSVVDGVSRAIDILERNLGHFMEERDGVTLVRMGGTHGANEAYDLIGQADALLPRDVRESWRWRLIYLRALIDFELASHEFRISERCAAAFEELTGMYHADPERALDSVCPPANLSGVIPCEHK